MTAPARLPAPTPPLPCARCGWIEPLLPDGWDWLCPACLAGALVAARSDNTRAGAS